MIEQLVSAISESTLREAALWALFNIPGLPPILQSLHIISIALLFASIGDVDKPDCALCNRIDICDCAACPLLLQPSCWR